MICGRLGFCSRMTKAEGRYKCDECVKNPPKPPVNTWTEKKEVEGSNDV